MLVEVTRGQWRLLEVRRVSRGQEGSAEVERGLQRSLEVTIVKLRSVDLT